MSEQEVDKGDLLAKHGMRAKNTGLPSEGLGPSPSRVIDELIRELLCLWFPHPEMETFTKARPAFFWELWGSRPDGETAGNQGGDAEARWPSCVHMYGKSVARRPACSHPCSH